MKQSPLRLRWVSYPQASYRVSELYEDDDSDEKLVACTIAATVKYSANGNHFAYVEVAGKEGDPSSPYVFSVSVASAFSFDLEVARREYKPSTSQGLVPIIAVNVCRILYASAREYLSMITSRATFGTAVLESVLLEPKDVQIDSDLDPVEVIKQVFQATPDEVAAFESRLAALRLAPESSEVPKKAKRVLKKP